MKKHGFWAVLLLFLLVLFVPGIGHADSTGTHISLDGKELVISNDAQVQIVNGTVMVPLRLVAEQLGYAVKWDNVTKTATIEQAGTILKLVLDNPNAEASGRQVKLDTPPFLSGNITLVPLRFVGEETGTKVGWDNPTKTVYLTSPLKAPESSGTQVTPLDTTMVNEANGSGAALTSLSFMENKLLINMTGTVTPSVFAINNKDRIVIDLPDTSYSPSFIQGLSLGNKQNGTIEVTDNPDVSAIRYSLFSNSPSTIRLVIDLNSPKAYSVINANDGHIIVDLNGADIVPTPQASIPAVPPVTPPPVIAAGTKLVVIDAGHGGKDPGGISVSKYNEKDFTLSTVLRIKKLLEKEPNLKLVLTRSDDSYPTLQERAKIANDMKADLFVSIHANSIPAGSKNNPSGYETYYTRKESLEFAKVVHKYLVPATGLSDRSIRQSSLYVTRETKMPAILLECGYLSNMNDEALLFNEDFQQRVAEAVVSGIKEYLGL
ncbi:N-acetylmuramoyl-L-alanine amidase family protein [Paenibacillus wynnii]|uniref:N-acetylmuramoyl-L-alanine amidase family protein n=1 Tax=Paenibacillus wynnii TaxID=268407 RepID=UPI0027919C30|nr:N-acetylmuramoyl-L-alanine amidase family protein [Paenibacillus wynnii]MDQ0194504.1 N-acetylmuramoyl-L-alanine amidase [Paenibacillus wynnii]